MVLGTDVIISYGDRYRIVNALNFWSTASSTSGYFGYNGEYRLATLIKSVTAIDQPAAYFVIDHGEAYYDVKNPESEMSISLADFYDLLRDRGLDVKTLEISKVDEIPEDCALLIINNPKSDFASDPDKYDELSYVSDLEKVDKYLVNRQGAVMVARDYDQTRRNPLPHLDDYLHEWGFDFSNSIVKDNDHSVGSSDGMDIITVYETNENSYANAIYGDFAALGTAPTTVIRDTGYIVNSYGEAGYKNEAGSAQTMLRYAPFLKTSASASAYNYSSQTGNYVDSSVLDRAGQLDLLALTVREAYNSHTNEYTHSYLFPNMIFAVALDYSPLDSKQKKKVLDTVTKELLTPRGLRSLSPKSVGYNPNYVGQQIQRDYAYHQGTAWPWLGGFYYEAYLKIYKLSGVSFVQRQMIGFEDEIVQHCIGSIPEVFDGNPPFKGRGAVAFAMNVAAILRTSQILKQYESKMEG